MTLLLICCCSLLLISMDAIGQEEYPPAAMTRNESFVRNGDSIVISYELVAPPDRSFDITIILKRERDPLFVKIPTALTGDFKGQTAGGPKTVVWYYRRDVQGELEGDDFYFEFGAQEVDKGGGLPWWVYAAGGAGVAVVSVILFSGAKDNPPPTVSTFPPEPARPGQ